MASTVARALWELIDLTEDSSGLGEVIFIGLSYNIEL
jgi:hypothetical protein